jgi:hypothetical protein
MVVDQVSSLILDIGRIAVWLKAVGIAAIVWLVFESVALWLNYKKLKEFSRVKTDIKRIEEKLNRVLMRQ